MSKFCIAFLLLLLVPSVILAADFVPVNKLDIDVSDFIQYDFGGEELRIPVEVTGAPAQCFLIIETTGLAGVLERVRNGRLGWHTVNKIDTTVYHSTSNDFHPGQNDIIWSGLDNDGNPLEEGTYTYYVWGFDYENTSQPAAPFGNQDAQYGRMKIYLSDENGIPFPKPWFTQILDPWKKWKLGNDPYNIELFETCDIVEPEGWGHRNRAPFDPDDYNYLYRVANNGTLGQQGFFKCKLIPNDIAEEVTDWGTDLIYTRLGGGQACDTYGGYLFAPFYNGGKEDYDCSLVIATLEGDPVEELFLPEWDGSDYVLNHPGVKKTGGPKALDMDKNGILYLGTIWCMHHKADLMSYLMSGDYEDFTMAVNEEGDGFYDKGWSADNPFPDYCFAEDPPWNYGNYAASNGFSTVANRFAGPISFTLNAPDMTAIYTCAVAGQNDDGQTAVMHIDDDTPYDGIYVDDFTAVRAEGQENIGTWYLGADQDKGTISKSGPTSVAAAAPAEFSVAQNVPNPCNPTTTINYTIPESGNVTVDVFNVAGQKVDTLVNNYLDAGSHSVVWDGSSKSSGVYFYTVTSGEFSKTIKMTLLK